MIRPPLPTDQGYIAATWARSILSGMRAGHALRRHGALRTAPREPGSSERQLRQLIGARIDAVLDRPDTRALVFGVDRESRPEMIVGWVLYVHGPSVPTVHYLYTRDHDEDGSALRGRGIARALLTRLGIDRLRPVVCTSDGPSSESMRGHFPASAYMPLDQFLNPQETSRR